MSAHPAFFRQGELFRFVARGVPLSPHMKPASLALLFSLSFLPLAPLLRGGDADDAGLIAHKAGDAILVKEHGSLLFEDSL